MEEQKGSDSNVSEQNNVNLTEVARTINLVISELNKVRARVNATAVVMSDIADGLDNIARLLMIVMREVNKGGK